MSAGFTPGPWGVELFGGSIYVGKLEQGAGREGFDDILYATDCKDYTASAVARALGNARLIAAAPELYEAAEALAGMTCLTTSNDDAESGCCAVCRARDALAKAKGCDS